jgi:hypothetical protein
VDAKQKAAPFGAAWGQVGRSQQLLAQASRPHQPVKRIIMPHIHTTLVWIELLFISATIH